MIFRMTSQAYSKLPFNNWCGVLLFFFWLANFAQAGGCETASSRLASAIACCMSGLIALALVGAGWTLPSHGIPLCQFRWRRFADKKKGGMDRLQWTGMRRENRNQKTKRLSTV